MWDMKIRYALLRSLSGQKAKSAYTPDSVRRVAAPWQSFL